MRRRGFGIFGGRPGKALVYGLLSATLLWGPGHALADEPSVSLLPQAIESQPLQQALVLFAKEAQMQLGYDSRLLEGKRSRGAPPGLTPADTLNRLLAGTDLSFEFLGPHLVKIIARPVVRAESASDVAAENRQPTRAMEPLLEEVLVTATKRETPVALVPLSVSVLAGDDLRGHGEMNIAEIAQLSPGLHFDFNSTFGPELLTNLTIRGLSTTNGRPLVGVYVDDVPIQSTLNAFRNAYPLTFDLDRVEVLRGPQGTIFGSNAPTGAVRFVTRAPSTTQSDALATTGFEFTDGGSVSSEVGAAGEVPIVAGVLGARASVWYRDEGGYIDRIDPFNGLTVDSNANRSVSKLARFALTYQPNETLQIIPSLVYQKIQLNDTPSLYVGLSDPDKMCIRDR